MVHFAKFFFIFVFLTELLDGTFKAEFLDVRKKSNYEKDKINYTWTSQTKWFGLKTKKFW